ncbi:hypothetical protein Cni_G06079 [Canna indica]|uniref:Uncharacterized protein n=1 Tax=Canna indica TaxID=4628 RepID=A0AAQ3JWI6_9LILI|nr:hypothetical protein Cni_G06079 [Canna indica]
MATKKADGISTSVLIPRLKKPPNRVALMTPYGSRSTSKNTNLPAEVEMEEIGEDQGLKQVADGKNPKRTTEPISWAGLFRRTIKEDKWRYSEDLNEKVKRIQEGAKGKVFIEEKDLEMAKNQCKWLLYSKFLGRVPPLGLVKEQLQKIWKLNADCKIVDLSLRKNTGEFFQGSLVSKGSSPIYDPMEGELSAIKGVN